MELQEKLKAYSERKAEEKAKEFARELGGFPKPYTLAMVNGHTRGWDEGFAAAAELLGGAVVCLEDKIECECGYETGSEETHRDAICFRCEALTAIERKLEEK
jgi:hypothetical protein